MGGPFTAWFEAEHVALGAQLRSCVSPGGAVDLVRFDAFRQRLLQRIAVEEKVLFPALIARLHGVPLYRRAVTKDHGGLVSLCAPHPSREWIEGLWEQLTAHHRVEMTEGGFCAQCDEALGTEAPALFARARALPVVVLPATGPGHTVRQRITELLVATGLSS